MYFAFLYTNNEIAKRKIKKTIPFPVAPKENKIPTSKFNQGCEKPVL